jgi:hypothetical protein
MIEIRPFKVDELHVAEMIGTESYPPEYYEGSSSFRSKVLANMDCCFVGLVDGNVAGYVIGFPYLKGRPYPIDEVYEPVLDPDCHYVHDLCVAYWARSLGLGEGLLEVALRGRGPTALVAVMDSEGFWLRFGFGTLFELDYYGRKAKYMFRGLS